MHTTAALATLTLLTSTALAQTPSLAIIEPPAGSIGTFRMDSARSAHTMTVRSTTANGPGGVDLRWTQAGGTQLYAGAPSGGIVYGISSDGERAVGHNFTAPRSMYTLANGSLANLGLPTGTAFEAQFIGANAWTNNAGTSVIANFRGTGDSRSPHRWTPAGGWQSLGGPLLVTRASDVTPDGSVMVGETVDFSTGGGFIYRDGQGYTLTNTFLPRAINDTGTIFVGSRVSGNGDGVEVAEMLTPEGFVSLGSFAGYPRSQARDVSNDGSLVVGILPGATLPSLGFVWTPSSGLRTLEDYLTDFGLALPANIGVTDIAITGDGSMISGTLGFPSGTRAFAIIVPAPTTALPLAMTALLATRRRR